MTAAEQFVDFFADFQGHAGNFPVSRTGFDGRNTEIAEFFRGLSGERPGGCGFNAVFFTSVCCAVCSRTMFALNALLLAALSGLAAGAVHVFSGPDHLAAIAPLSLNRSGRGWVSGARWALG